MHKRSRTAIEKILSVSGNGKMSCAEDGSWVKVEGAFDSFEVHRLASGKWVVAEWSERHNQWQSSDFTAQVRQDNPQSRYAFAHSLSALSAQLKKYHSPASAIKSVLFSD